MDTGSLWLGGTGSRDRLPNGDPVSLVSDKSYHMYITWGRDLNVDLFGFDFGDGFAFTDRVAGRHKPTDQGCRVHLIAKVWDDKGVEGIAGITCHRCGLPHVHATRNDWHGVTPRLRNRS